MPTPLYTYVTKTNTQVRDDILRTIKNGLISIGVPNPNVGPSSDYYLTATAVSTEIAVGLANITIKVDGSMPDTAGGSDLDRWLNIINQSRRPAIGSFGVVTLNTSVASTLVTVGQQLLDENGLRYEVSVGGNYGSATTLYIPVESIDVGKATNHANGDTLTWVTAPAFCAATVSVGTTNGTDGLEGGADSDVGVDEPPRARLLYALANPAKAGNSADVVSWCLESSPIVQSAWVYPALMGPGTTFAAVAQQPTTTAPLTSTAKSRQIPNTLLIGTVQPYVQGLLPEHVFSVIASVVDQPTDVAIQLSLPSAPTASPPGPGGGWVDGSPWPQTIFSGSLPVTVSSAASSTSFHVNAQTPPIPGVSHIAWLSPYNWTLYTAIVLSYSGTSGNYIINVDTPMPGISTGCAIWPQAVQMLNYCNALLQAFSLMGPGEWSSSLAVLGRAYRHPPPQLSWPYSLSPVQLKYVINAGPEVLDANYIYRSSTTPTVPTTPTVDTISGALTSPAPNILIPRHLSFYQQ